MAHEFHVQYFEVLTKIQILEYLVPTSVDLYSLRFPLKNFNKFHPFSRNIKIPRYYDIRIGQLI